MEKIVESFFDAYSDDFFEYFDRYKVLKIMQNKEYKKINQQICSVKEKYPKVISLLEDKESVVLNYEEGKAINKIFECLSQMKIAWNSTDNVANIEKIEEYRNIVIEKSKQLEQMEKEEPKMEELGQ